MKTTLATVTFLIALLGARLTAAPDATQPIPSVEQQFQQADVQLAIEQFKKLRMAAFDLELKLQTETNQSEEQRKHLDHVHAKLQERAEQLRAMTIRTAAVAVANTR